MTDTKTCTRCRHPRPVTQFAIDRGNRSGRSAWCKPCRNEWGKANRERTRDVEYAAKLVSRYGITIAQYDALLAAQGGHCAICPSTKPGGHGGRRFHVDHDHVTGAVRGLLCSPCNSGLGHLGDDLARLRAALAYLEAHQ